MSKIKFSLKFDGKLSRSLASPMTTVEERLE
jgi:hypothetical protein